MSNRRRFFTIVLMGMLVLPLSAVGEEKRAARPAMRPIAQPLAAVPASQPPEPVRAGLVVTRAETGGRIEDGLARLTMEIGAESYAKEEQSALLFASDVAITEWQAKGPFFGGKAFIRRTDRGVELVTDGKGKYALRLTFVVRVSKERLGRKLVFPVVPALVASTRLTVPGKDLEFKAQPALSLETEADDDQTIVTLYGGEGEVSLTWTPKAPEKVLKPVVFADQTLRIQIGQGVMRMTSAIDYSIVQGSVGEFELRLPPDCSLLNIEGKDIRTWDIAETEGAAPRTLKVALLGEVEQEYHLTLSLEKVLADLKMEFEVPSVEPLNVIREKGQIAVFAAKGISVEAALLENISHVDVREMLKLPQISGEEVRLGFRYLKRPFALKVRTDEVGAKTSVEIVTLVRAGMDSMRLTSDLNYTIRDAGVFQFQARLGEGLKLIDIEGTNINNWQLDEAGRILTVALRSKAEGMYKLQVETELEKPAGEKAAVPAVHALGADREAGYVAILPAPGIKVETAALTGISQIDVKELPKEVLKESPALAYRYIRPDYAISINVSEIEAEVQAEVRTVATLDEHELSMDTEIHYTIRRAGIFQLRVAIPKDLRRTNIEGEQIDDTSWDEKSGILTVNLSSKVTGKYVLKLATEKSVKTLDEGLELPVISALGVKKERGFIGLVTRASVRIKPAEGKMVGLDDISVSDLPPEMLKGAAKISLAFKYFTQPWSLALAIERIESRVTVEAFNLLSIGEKLMTVSATFNYQILHAGVDTFVLKLPTGASAVDIDGDSIKHREEDKEKHTWTITLQSKRKDTYSLYVSFQQKLAAEQPLIPYTGVTAMNVQRETGYLTVTSRPDVEITVADEDIENLTPIDGREVPKQYMQGVTLPVLQAYRYVSHPYMLRIGAAPHAAADVTVAVIEGARLSTTITEEGNMITDLVAMLRNSRQQYLDLALPENARIWHAFVGGEAVTPVEDGQITKIYVARSSDTGAPFEVRLRYSDDRDEEMWRIGAIKLESPIKGIDIMRLGWTLSLPEGYDVVRDTGNIKRLDNMYDMDPRLRDLHPDVEVRVRARRPAAVSKKMDYQARRNVAAIQQIEIGEQTGAGQRQSIYTGSKPTPANTFVFQSLIVGAKESAWVEVQYVKGSVAIPLKGVVVLIVLGFSGLIWRWRRRRPIVRAGILFGCVLIALAVITLTEGAYRGYLTVVTLTLLGIAVIMLIHTIVAWLRELWQRRQRRMAEAFARAYPPPPPPPPAPPQPPYAAPRQQAPPQAPSAPAQPPESRENERR